MTSTNMRKNELANLGAPRMSGYTKNNGVW